MAFVLQGLPPANTITCPDCTGMSGGDLSGRYCTACGKCLILSDGINTTKGAIDFTRIQARIAELDHLSQSSNYSKQKLSLEVELERFLRCLGAHKSVSNALPEDIRMFIIHKETHGRTKMHSDRCSFRGMPGRSSCNCPITMSSKSVDSLIGKVRAICRDSGRCGEWNPSTGVGNPASAQLLKRHLKSVTAEQTVAEVTHKQAVPLMFDKLAMLCRHLSYKCYTETDPTKKLLYARDCAYFSILSHSGGRGGDMGLLTSSRIFELPKSQGILISQIEGKTVNVDNPNNIILLLSKDPDICPVTYLQSYINIAVKAGIVLRTGYLFRSRDHKTQLISGKPVTSGLMTDRLRTHLTAIGAYEGETAHSGRRGCAIALRMLGLSDSSIASHIGWGSTSMLDHYASMGGSLSPSGAAGTLSAAAEMKDNSSRLTRVSAEFKSFSNLKRFGFGNI